MARAGIGDRPEIGRITGLKLPTPNVVRFTLPGLDFGTLHQLIEVSFRKKAVSDKPFVAPL